jgi:hypothetical protein
MPRVDRNEVCSSSSRNRHTFRVFHAICSFHQGLVPVRREFNASILRRPFSELTPEGLGAAEVTDFFCADINVISRGTRGQPCDVDSHSARYKTSVRSVNPDCSTSNKGEELQL